MNQINVFGILQTFVEKFVLSIKVIELIACMCQSQMHNKMQKTLVQLLINGIFFFGGGGDYGFLSMKVAKPPKLI